MFYFCVFFNIHSNTKYYLLIFPIIKYPRWQTWYWTPYHILSVQQSSDRRPPYGFGAKVWPRLCRSILTFTLKTADSCGRKFLLSCGPQLTPPPASPATDLLSLLIFVASHSSTLAQNSPRPRFCSFFPLSYHQTFDSVCSFFILLISTPLLNWAPVDSSRGAHPAALSHCTNLCVERRGESTVSVRVCEYFPKLLWYSSVTSALCSVIWLFLVNVNDYRTFFPLVL